MNSENIAGQVQLQNVVKIYPAQHKDKPVRAVDDIDLTINTGEFFALLGPSGCGKTTTLRLIAGLEQPDEGQLTIAGLPMRDVPAYKRPVNTVFQDYVLFPHMTILQNVMFGLRMSHVPRQEARDRAMEVLEMVQLPQVAKRKPHQLSGGQQQRVALARALVNRPRVLLLDEPLGALDLKLRREMQTELKTLQQQLGITFIYVTHDQDEAMSMASRIAVMEGGHVAQVGRPQEIYSRPATKFVADFVGEMNFLMGTLVDTDAEKAYVRLSDDSVIAASRPYQVTLKSAVVVGLRPEHIWLYSEDGSQAVESGYNSFNGVIEQVQYRGAFTMFLVRVSESLVLKVVQANSTTAGHFAVGEPVLAAWDPDDGQVMPANG